MTSSVTAWTNVSSGISGIASRLAERLKRAAFAFGRKVHRELMEGSLAAHAGHFNAQQVDALDPRMAGR